MRQPRIYPISFSVSISRVWRVYRGLKTCFSSRGVVSAPQNPNCSFAMPPHFVFSLQQERQSNEVNYSLDVKKRLLVKKKKKKTKGCNFINGRTPPCYRLGIRYSIPFPRISRKTRNFYFTDEGWNIPFENALPPSYRRVNETQLLKGNFVTTGRNKFLLKTRMKRNLSFHNQILNYE